MRSLALLSLLCACSSLAQDERTKLTSYQRNAALYFEGSRLDQAMIQCEKGLELEPDDYKLKAIKGAILLRASGTASSTDHKRLDEATKVLAEVHDQRSNSRHEPSVLLYYGQALQKQGQRHLGAAIRAEGDAQRTPDAKVAGELQEQAAAERALATADLQQAWDLFGVLIERGEILRFAHNHRMQIAGLRKEDAVFTAEAEQFLLQSQKAKDSVAKQVQDAKSVDFEAERMRTLAELKSEELEVRSLVADFHFDRKNYDSALTQLNRVLEIDPQRSTDYYNRGRVLLELGKQDEARRDFLRFLQTTSLPTSADQVAFAHRAIK